MPKPVRGFTLSSKAASGFTLIELLVVISIIAILSMIGITVFTNVSNNARKAKVQADFDSMYKNLEQARYSQQKTFYQITGSWCSFCEGSCHLVADVSTDATCINKLTTNWAKVTSAPIPKDPWGNPYIIDENELEPNWGGDMTPQCQQDTFISAGPNHKMDLYCSGDDTCYKIPFFSCEAGVPKLQ